MKPSKIVEAPTENKANKDIIKIDNNNSTRRFFTLSFTFINVVIDYVTRRTLATIMIMNLFRSQEIVAFFNKHKKERKNLPY